VFPDAFSKGEFLPCISLLLGLGSPPISTLRILEEERVDEILSSK